MLHGDALTDTARVGGARHTLELRVCVNMVGQTTHILLSGAGVWTVERLQCAQWRDNLGPRSSSPGRPRSGGGRRLVRIRIYGSRAPTDSEVRSFAFVVVRFYARFVGTSTCRSMVLHAKCKMIERLARVRMETGVRARSENREARSLSLLSCESG